MKDDPEPRVDAQAPRRAIPSAGSRLNLPNESPIIGGVRDWLTSTPVKIGGIVVALGVAVAFVSAVFQAANSLSSAAGGAVALAEAHRLVDSGKFAAAVPLYSTALGQRLSPGGRANAYLGRGWAYANIAQDANAIRDFDAALAIQPNLVFAVLDRGLAFHRQGNFNRAMADYAKTIWLDPNTVDAYRNRALILAHRGQFQEAIADMNEAVRCAPRDPRWFARRGQIYLLMHEFEPAVASFESALRIDPENLNACLGRAHIRIANNEEERAVAEITEDLRLHPESAQLMLARALVYQDLEELEKALDDCIAAIELKKDYGYAYAVRASLEFEFGAFDAAIALAGLALQLDPKMPLPHQVRGRVLERRQEYAEAIAEFDRAVALDSEYVPPLVWRGLTKAHAGDYEGGRRELETTVENFPGEARAHGMLAWFLATCPEATFRNGERAIAEAQRSVLLSHQSAASIDVLATAFAEAGDFERARELEGKALDKTPARASDCHRMEYRLQEFWLGIPHRDHEEAE